MLEYDAPKRHAHKKAEPEQRRSKTAREMAKVVEKLKCREVGRVVLPRRATRASSEGQLPTRPLRLSAMDRDTFHEVQSRPHRAEGQSKRPRAEPSRHEGSSDVVCCIHGDPCRLGCRGDDAVMDRFIERFGDRLVRDTDENNIVARFAKAVVERAKGLLGARDRPSRSRPSPEEGRRRSMSRTPTHAPGFEFPLTEHAESSSHNSFVRELDRDIPSPHRDRGNSPDSVGSDVPEVRDRQGPVSTLAGRLIRPSAILQSPFVSNIDTPTGRRFNLVDVYNEFRRMGDDAVVETRQPTPYVLTQQLFNIIENEKEYMVAEVIWFHISFFILKYE